MVRFSQLVGCAAGVQVMQFFGGPSGSRVFQFTKAGTLQTSPTDLENAAASALAGVSAGATFVTLNDDGVMRHLLVTDTSPGQEGAAFSAARAMASRSDEVDEVPDLLRVPAVARLQFREGTTPLQNTQAGADFTMLSRIVSDMLMPGEWVAVSVRKAQPRREARKQAVWLDYHGMRTHHSRRSGAPVAQFFAASSSNTRARELLSRAVEAIPGFGLSVRTRSVSVWPAVFAWLGLSAVGVAGYFLGGVPTIASWLPVFENVKWGGAVVAAVCLVAAVLTGRGLLPSPLRQVRRFLQAGRVPVAPFRWRNVRAPKRERDTLGTDGRRVITESFDGDYPLALSAFLVGAHIPLAFAAPHTGAASGSSATGERVAPPVLRDRVGPMVGVNADLPVYLSVQDLWGGLALVGQPGSGKTAFLEALWGYACRERVSPLGIVGTPKQHALIAFDTKEDGLASVQYRAWSQAVGDRALMVNTADPAEQVGLELFPDVPGEDASDWARRVVNAFIYLWGTDSIGANSFDTLIRVFSAAKLVTPAIASRVQEMPLRLEASPFYYADVLLTNRGDEAGVELAAALADAAVQPAADPGLAEVVASLRMYAPGFTPAQRQRLMEAPRTKVAALTALEQWWSRPKRATWHSLLSKDAAVIVNLGMSGGHSHDDKLRSELAGLMMYTLQGEIKRTCVGWFEQDRAVSVFSDEVKHIAASSAEVLTWMRNDARAYGVRPKFATQTPDTLQTEVRRALFGFANLMMFAQDEAATVRELVDDLTMSGGEWDKSDIANLNRFEVIVRATFQGRRLEPFTGTVPDFRAQRGAGTWEG